MHFASNVSTSQNFVFKCCSLCPFVFCAFHRPWYVAAAVPEPKDVVIVIDRSGSMLSAVRGTGRTRLDIAKEAVNIVLDTLNPTDRVSAGSSTVIVHTEWSVWEIAALSKPGDEVAILLASQPNCSIRTHSSFLLSWAKPSLFSQPVSSSSLSSFDTGRNCCIQHQQWHSQRVFLEWSGRGHAEQHSLASELRQWLDAKR